MIENIETFIRDHPQMASLMGLIATILTSAAAWFAIRYHRSQRQVQKGGDNSINIQSGGDTHIGGRDPRRVRQGS